MQIRMWWPARRNIILKASDKYEISQENMGVGSEEEWNNTFASYIGTYGPVKVRFILSVFKNHTTQIFVYTPYGFGIGFDSPDNVETLKEALNAYNAKHGALTEPDGTVVTFEPVEVK